MKQTLIMEALQGETRLAVIEDNRLCELHVERPGGDDVVGSIFLGRVENVLPGMNAAFVDIGAEKNGFLYAGDIQFHDQGIQKKLDGLRIERLVCPGQELLLQVTKVQSGQKGHRVSCHVTLPGRLLVLLPGMRYTGVSRKIADDAERDRLHAIARQAIGGSGDGVIVRTAAKGADADEILREYESLRRLWADVSARAQHAIAPRKVFSNDSLVLRCARDMLSEDTEAVWVDGEGLYDALMRQAEALAPRFADRIHLHEGQVPLFDLHRVDAQLDKAMGKYVWLKSGGSLVIEETEAMTVIDVNTARFTGKKNLEETLLKLNCEAAEEIVRQLRLRDISGIVIVDFIDMAKPESNEALLEQLKALAWADRNRLTVVGMTGLGLVELTRKRERRPLSRLLMHTCSDCGGDGTVPSHETTARRAIRDIWRRHRMGEASPLLCEAAEPVAGWMRRIGTPEGARVYVRAVEGMKAGEYRLAPADEAHLPDNTKMLK